MKNIVYILTSNLKSIVQDLWANKFRTFLSLFGITIGIFCMIGVLSTIKSLDANIQKDLNTIGSNTLFISKWQWTPSSKDYPTWKMAARPSASLADVAAIQEYSSNTESISYTYSEQSSIEKNNNVVSPINLYAADISFLKIQDLTISAGRNITVSEFNSGTQFVLIGYENAIRLFGNMDKALLQTIKIKQVEFTIIGVLQKYGRNILQGWDYDNCAIIPNTVYQQKFLTKKSEPFIMAKPKKNISLDAYYTELKSILRNNRKLHPTQEDNFSINNISVFKESIESITKYVQLGGSVIAFFSLLVGAFGIANIMYVTVRERTKIIGLKKALGATNAIIKRDFLIESVFLCLIGGFLGLLLLFLSILFFSKVFGFLIVVQPFEIFLTILLCTIIGMASGYFPASKAAKLNPVVAIRG